ncbi:MAG: hypothetical protein FWG51_04750, partial [Firmicutes bacterium]|nr:hypothetical protein [Bacillota bacterium]
MKKFLALAFAALFSTSALAAEFGLKNFEFYGEGLVTGFSVSNSYDTTPPTNMGFVNTMNILGVKFDVSDNIYANIAAGYVANWGDYSMFYGVPTYGKTVQDYWYEIRIVEANLLFKDLFDCNKLSAKVGRQFYGDGDSMVMYFGPATNRFAFGADVYSLDALTLYYDNENIKANAVYANIYDQSGNSYSSGNETIMGFDIKYAAHEMFDVQAYLYDTENYYSTTRHNTLVGIKPAVKIDGFKASVELAKQFAGEQVFSDDETAYNTNFIKVDASFEIEKFTPRAMFFVGGGEGKTFRDFGTFAPGLIYSNTILNSDEQIINAGVDYKHNDKLTL